MGILDFILKSKNNTNTNYDMKKEENSINNESTAMENTYQEIFGLYKKLDTETDLQERKTLLEKAIYLLNSVDKNKFNELTIKKSIKDGSYGYKTDFGWIANNWNIIDKLLEKFTKSASSNDFRIKRLKEFEEDINNISKHQITLNNVEIEKRKLQDLSEINIAKVGKQFNKEKLFKYVVIDIETTGLKANSDEIIELSAIKYIDYEPIECFSTLIKPKKEISEEITQINSITNQMVENAPKINEVLSDFDDFVKGFNIVGYNIPFDLKFLYCNGSNILNQKGIKIYDVCELTRKAYKDLCGYSLDDVCKEVYNLYRKDSHRSLSDCFSTDIIFSLCLDKIID